MTADFVYARFQRGTDDIDICYPPDEMNCWARRAKLWAEGETPDDLPYVAGCLDTSRMPRDVFVYFIHEGKVRAPHGAMAFMELVTA